MNSIGSIFRLTTFGESHGVCVGGVIDGCPSGIVIDIEKINQELEYRRTGASKHSSQRNETDKVQFLSGLYNNTTLGTPIAFIINNTDARSSDYDDIKDVFRPSHADYTYYKKYGIRDYRGGGRASARETAVRVVAGAIAKQILNKKNINITAWTSSIGNITDTNMYGFCDRSDIYNSTFRNPNRDFNTIAEALISELKAEKDTIGGTISCVVENVPIGLGEPIYDKVQSRVAAAIFSINAVRGFEFGKGFEAAKMLGSQHNDSFYLENNTIKTKTNNDGGIQGGITNGNDLFFRVAFKPISSIGIKQHTVDENNTEREICIKGRHDVCPVPRAVIVVEAVVAITLLDLFLLGNNKPLAFSH
ncbi:MAG: chorismate synthase [Lentimicrobiaceae bacterium]|nr:chorismate synthase [Lentimicrobiaceae bacterium]